MNCPLRVPTVHNVLIKTCVRVVWYLKEVVPLFLLASFVIWLCELCGLIDVLASALRTPVHMMGLPDEAATVFLFGFFRRDYGTAGLYDLSKHGQLSGVQLVVASVALTLFLPCIAQFLMNVKERGWRTGLGISAFVMLVAFGVGCVLNLALTAAGVKL